MIPIVMVAVQLTAEQENKLADGIKDIRAIDAELQEITEHQDVLRRSKAARVDEIASLRSRYPEIVVTDASTVEQVYKALYAVRVSRAAKVRPLARENLRLSHVEACRASRSVQDMRVKIEAGDGYKGMTLSERLEWRKSMDAINQESDCTDVPR